MKKSAGIVLILLCLATAMLSSLSAWALNTATVVKKPNFTGHWERDFRRSDDWQAKLETRIRQIRKAIARQSSRQGADVGTTAAIANSAHLVDLARFAESITRQSIMQIEQNENTITITRDGDAALICGFNSSINESFSSINGSEICAWDAHQLVFKITLPDRLVVVHRLSLSPNRRLMNMATSVSLGSSTPFSLTRVFQYFEPVDNGLNCDLTVSRGRVCSTTVTTP